LPGVVTDTSYDPAGPTLTVTMKTSTDPKSRFTLVDLARDYYDVPKGQIKGIETGETIEVSYALDPQGRTTVFGFSRLSKGAPTVSSDPGPLQVYTPPANLKPGPAAPPPSQGFPSPSAGKRAPIVGRVTAISYDGDLHLIGVHVMQRGPGGGLCTFWIREHSESLYDRLRGSFGNDIRVGRMVRVFYSYDESQNATVQRVEPND
jgi:hypothetical protein